MSVTDVGLTELLNRTVGLTGSFPPYIAVGSGTTAVSGTDTALATEIATRQVSTVITVSGDTLTLKAFFPTGQGNGTIAEHGLFTLSAAGICMERSLESPTVTKTSAKEMVVEYHVTMARG